MMVKIKYFVLFVIVWTIIVTTITSMLYRQKLSYLNEENKYILMWIANRHGEGWAKRIKEWSHQKARRTIPDIITEDNADSTIKSQKQ